MSYKISSQSCLYFYPFTSDYNNYATSPEGINDSLENIEMTLTPTTEFGQSLGSSAPNTNASILKIPNFTFNDNGANISFWYKLNNLSVVGNARIGFDFGNEFCVYMPGGIHDYGIFLYNTSLINQIGPFYSLGDTNWHFFSFNFKDVDGVKQLDIIVDGEIVTTSNTYVYNYNENNCVGGVFPDSCPNFSMNNFMVFNRSLTTEELQILQLHPTDFTLDYSYTINNQSDLTNFLNTSGVPEAFIKSNINVETNYTMINGTDEIKCILSEGKYSIIKTQE